MSNETSTIVQRLWNYCNVLRDDGMSYGDYLEQLTYLLFLKMDDEKVRVLHEVGYSLSNSLVIINGCIITLNGFNNFPY
jgi:hypothetical protein